MDGIMMIDWQSLQNEILFNPRMPDITKEDLFSALSLLEHLKGHVCFSTSGSSGKLKWVLLPKSGILASASAVNKHLNSSSQDIWLNPLPNFHVGGVGILARSHLSGAKAIPCQFESSKWNPLQFLQQLKETQATLTSLVPTQVFDLVSNGIQSPESLRASIVGGGALNEKIYFLALQLGWKLLPSYGLTECASQVATAEYGSWNENKYPLLKPLEHVEIGVDLNGYLKIKSNALLTGYLESMDDKFCFRDPKKNGWFITEDKPTFEYGFIKSIHREQHFVKIGGENVDLLRLEKILEEEKLSLKFGMDVALIALEDERLGHRIHLAIASELKDELSRLMELYHQRVFPFERIACVHSVPEIPRSPLNKVMQADLKAMIQKTDKRKKVLI
jgi:O-succinylbenzoic acid--CoA ligase